jgi:hypothetical protein
VPIEEWVKLAIAVTSGGLLTKSLDWIRDARAGHMKKRRAEVDNAISARDKAAAERDTAEAMLAHERAEHARELRWWERWARILEEHLAITRRKYIDAPCTDTDDLDPYPSRPDRDKP